MDAHSRATTVSSGRHHSMTPSLFPCASRVKMPQIGSDETKFKPRKIIKAERTFLRSGSLPPDVKTNYVKRVSSGLTFSEDVLKERCFHLLPYSDKYFYEALDYTNLIPRPPKATVTPGRHNTRGADNRHLPCHIKKRTTHQLKPMKRKILERAAENNQRAAAADADGKEDEEKGKETNVSFFLTEAQPEATTASADDNPLPPTPVNRPLTKPEGIDRKEWDAYLMSLLSQSTAQWIVKSRLSPGEQQQELEELLTVRYGETGIGDDVELIQDNISEADLDTGPEEEKKKWRKGEETLLDRVRDMTKLSEKPSDPYSDDSGAAFYRLPAGVRRARKYQQKEELGAINQTAHGIKVSSYEAPPPPTLRDYMNPQVTNTMYNSDSMFIQEWLTGAKQVYQRDEDPNKIVLDTNNKYKKVLQKESPGVPEDWFPTSEKEKEKHENDRLKLKRYSRGLHRWKSLPEPIDPGEGVLNAPNKDDHMFMHQDTAEKFKLMAPGADNEYEKAQELAVKQPVKPNETLVTIVSDWRSKWHLDMRYADATPEDLIRDMADLHSHIRLKAITTCARAAEYKPPPDPGLKIESDVAKEPDSNSDGDSDEPVDKFKAMHATSVDHVRLLPRKLFVALECCLEDENEQVRRAAAIALYTLEKPTDKAEEILRTCLDDEQSNDRWTAAQCLAYYGECDSDVVGELIKQLLYTEDLLRYEQAGKLLSALSDNSTLVHSMIAEQMNSSSWRHRVMACQIVPRLKGKLNKDLVNKLTTLMWNDWHHEVRKTAAQTLGRTGHGKEVHDELRVRILDGDERSRIEAVSKVGHLGIMTAKLLPAFLEVFHDNYVSVRMEACIASSNLKVNEPALLEKLVHLATFDPIWRVKALAIQALGVIKTVTAAIRECVTWAFRYEDKPGVRAQACHTLCILELKDPEVAQMLQDRFLVETSDVVKTQIVEALGMFDISPTEDMDMVAQIKNEVRKLCTRNNICAHITLNEKDETKQANHQRMIYQEPGEEKAAADKSPERPSTMRPRSQASQASQRPHIVITDEERPYSRETSALTPTVDREIQAVLTRHGRGTPGADSRSESARTRRTIEDSIIESDEDALYSEVESAASRGKSAYSGKSRATTNTNNSASDSKPSTAPQLSERRTYVEISEAGADSEDVVTVTHESPSPRTGGVEGAGEGGDAASRPSTSGLDKPREPSPANSAAPSEKTSRVSSPAGPGEGHSEGGSHPAATTPRAEPGRPSAAADSGSPRPQQQPSTADSRPPVKTPTRQADGGSAGVKSQTSTNSDNGKQLSNREASNANDFSSEYYFSC